MSITRQGILDLEAEINDILAEDCVELHFTFHAAFERLNDPRNNPAISLAELDEIFRTFITTHLATVIAYPEGTTFTIRCNRSHIHLPCAIKNDVRIGKTWVIQSVVTVQRKVGFISKDRIILEIN